MSRFGMFPKHGASAAPKPTASGEKGVPLVAGIPLGAIISRKFEPNPHIIMLHQSTSPIAERYRRLRLRLDHPDSEQGPRQVIVVTSAVPEEGKTTTSINLALAFAEDRDRRTLLVDADLRRPSVLQYLSPRPTLGLSEVLNGQAPLDHAIIPINSVGLSILPAGSPSVNPVELLRSKNLASVFAELRRRFDRIVVDTPPTVPFIDAAVLNALADGAILVVRARRTARALVERASASLTNGALLGAVLNDVEYTPVDRYYYQYDDYNPHRYADRGSTP